MNQKRGQLTVFIIIGLLLLVTVSIVVYVTTQRVAKPIEEQIIVPEDAKPVYEYVSKCAQESARDAVNILGMQGGYIYIPARIAKTPTSYIPLDENAFYKLPYWYYEGEDRTPSLAFMENELKKYITENLRQCVGEFAPFKERMEITEKGNITASVLIAEENVIAKINWPLELKTGGRTTEIKEYIMKLPVRLKQVWTLANKTMMAENKHSYFENMTINLMAGDPEIPMDGIEFTCTSPKWTIPEIRKRLQRVLYYNMPNVRIENTNYAPFSLKRSAYEGFKKEADRIYNNQLKGKKFEMPETQAPEDAFEYFHQKFDASARPTDLKAGFEYQPEWGMLISAQPDTGGVLKASKIKGAKWLKMLCIQQWHFVYDIIYPVKMSIRDDSAFDNSGFVFQFAFPVIINDNAPERVYFGLRRFEMTDYETEFCQNLGEEIVDIRAVGFVVGLPFAVELSDAEISMKCVTEECLLGNTTADGGVYRLNTLLPRSCANPWIIAEKPGYLTAQKQLEGNRIDLVMKKLQPFDAEIVVHPYYGPTGQWLEPRAPGKNEEITMRISLVNSTFEQFAGAPENETRISLVQEDAYYEIDAVLLFNGNQIGGYNADIIKIPYEDFAGREKIVLNVPAYLPTPMTSTQKLEMLDMVLGLNYQEKLRPEFK